MSIVPDTHVVSVEITADEARRLTDTIKTTADQLWALLLEAHQRKAWAVLGYPTWEDYVRVEFDMSRQHSYRLLDRGRVVAALASAAGVSPVGDIASERETRDLKPVLEEVTSEIADRVTDDLRDDERVGVVREVIDGKRRATRPRPTREERALECMQGYLYGVEILTNDDLIGNDYESFSTETISTMVDLVDDMKKALRKLRRRLLAAQNGDADPFDKVGVTTALTDRSLEANGCAHGT